MPAVPTIRLREHDIEEILALFKKYRKAGYGIMEACRKVQADTEVPYETVYHVQRRFRPTTDAATDYIRANSLRLAMRVVRKANVEQAIGILSRPNIGVLDPQGESGVGGGRMFQIGVSVDSLGSVKVGVQIGESETQPALGPGSAEPILQGEAQEAPDEAEGLEESPDEEVRPKRVWHKKDPKPRTAPLELPPARSERGPGANLNTRLAQAKAQRKEEAAKRRKDKRTVQERMRQLAAELGQAKV
jgi:hypothetical protein